MFSYEKTLTEQTQAEILAKTNEYYAQKTTQIQENEARIKEILDLASKEKRELTQGEVDEITRLQNQMRDDGIKALSESELEAQVILQRMKDYDQRLTAEQAAEHISKLNQTRDEAVRIAEDNYEKNIREITKLRDEAGVLTAEQADIMIANAKKQKEEIIQKAEDTRLGAIDKIRSLHSELDDVVDTGTGKILSWWDKLKRWWSGWKPETKSFNVAGNFSSGGRWRSAAVGGGGGAGFRYSGDNNFKGGYTYLHEKGWELYDLPKGTRIYHHEASQELVLQTAEKVASKVANEVLRSGINKSGNINVTQNIYSTTSSPAETARRTKNALRELALEKW